MSAHRFLSTTLAALGLTLASLALSVAPAAAAPLLPLSAFTDGEAFQYPEGMVVDQSSGDVYVIDAGFGAGVDKFDAAGNPVAFSASASYIKGNQLTGTPSEAFHFLTPSGAGIAIDQSGGLFNGDIYVTDSVNRAVDVFAPSGAYLGQLTSSYTSEGELKPDIPCGVAVDGSGRVYVAEIFGEAIKRYTPSIGTLPVADGDYSASELSGVGRVCPLAVDAAGDVFASTWQTGPLNEYTQAQFPASGSAIGVASEIAPVSKGVAVDQASGDVFVDDGEHVSVYEAGGGIPTLIETFGSLSGGSLGLAVKDGGAGGDTVYASDAGAKVNPAVEQTDPTVDVFGPAVAAAPAVAGESTTSVTASSAELHAQVNPDFAETTYHFEYGTTSAYGAEAPAPGLDIGAAGGLAGAQEVSAHIQGLAPGATYHYRVVASNGDGTVPGADATFTTRAPSGPLALIDGRAWEMVSPPDKSNSLLIGIDGYPGGTRGDVLQAAADGESIVYASNGAFSEPSAAPLAAEYLAKRSEGGWATTNLNPPISAESYSAVGFGGPYKAFSTDLSTGVLLNGDFLPVRSPPLPGTGAPVGYQNLYLRNAGTGAAEALLTSAPAEPAESFKLEFEEANPELTHIVFSSKAALTPNAIDNGGPNLYDWSNGQLSLINVLPHETMGTPGAVVGEDNAGAPGGLRAMSTSGSVIFFTDQGNLYARVDGTRTIQVDESKEGLESGGGRFQAASADGLRVFFTDSVQLTSDTTGVGTGLSNLYELDLGTGQLSDLTTADPTGGNVERVVGASADGAYVYFVADGILAPGASHGRCELGISGGGRQTCNLYVWHQGTTEDTTKFIATLSQEDNLENPTLYKADDWSPSIQSRTSRVTPDGLNLVFMSNGDLTGYDNTPAEPADCGNTPAGTVPPVFITTACEEVYDYNAAGEGHLSCASCNPSGARPIGPSSIPGGTQFEVQHAIYQSRVVSDDAQGRARVFFDSRDALVSGDGNGQQDVYEWEQGGRGGCAGAGGCVGLVSSGTSSSESSFVDADADGKNVFFLTSTALVGQDADQLLDLYDAREGGGFPAAPTPPACTGTGCQGVPPTAPIFATPSSVTFAGVGNFPAAAPPAVIKPKAKKKTVKCAKGKHLTHSKCVKSKKKAKKAKKATRASNNRRAKS